MTEPRLNYVLCPGAASARSPLVAPDAPAAGPGQHRMAYWEWNGEPNGKGNPAHPHVVLCVHGLSRQGRDFDALARALNPHARVVCPDMPGRGRSDWLADPMAYAVPQYAADILSLLAQLQREAPIQTLDWVGTSMGGLIGMAVCGQPGLCIPDDPNASDQAVGSHWPLAVPVRRLVLNDIGPRIDALGLQRIGEYLGQPVRFDTLEQAAEALRPTLSGPHRQEDWLALTRHMLRPAPEGGLMLHYDPDIAQAFRAAPPGAAAEGEALMWQLYDRIRARTLLLRGLESDILSAETAQAMAQRGPRAQIVEFPGVGHAPTLVTPEQIGPVVEFLLAPEQRAAG